MKDASRLVPAVFGAYFQKSNQQAMGDCISKEYAHPKPYLGGGMRGVQTPPNIFISLN